jgi:hypothetical protein
MAPAGSGSSWTFFVVTEKKYVVKYKVYDKILQIIELFWIFL